jgi:hypothetical protein
MIELTRVPDAYLEQALSADERFLEPGCEQTAIDEMANDAIPRDTITFPELWYLNPAQMREFVEDFETPTVSRYEPRVNHSLSRYSLLQLCLAASLGTPYGLPDQRDGVVVQDIFPRSDLLNRPNSSFGANQNFSFHTDQAYNPSPSEVPDYVLLSSVRNDEAAPTIISHLPEALAKLSLQSIKQLHQSDFLFFRGRPEENLGVRIGPVLVESNTGNTIRIGTDILGQSMESAQALEEMHNAIAAVSQSVTLLTGQTLAFPNNTTPHARPGFQPATNPEKRRWLQRVFVKSS